MSVCSESQGRPTRRGTTYSDAYCRYFLKIFLCVKNGERVQTSASLTVRAFETLNNGSTNENVDQLQRSTLSSGIVNLFEGGFGTDDLSDPCRMLHNRQKYSPQTASQHSDRANTVPKGTFPPSK